MNKKLPIITSGMIALASLVLLATNVDAKTTTDLTIAVAPVLSLSIANCDNSGPSSVVLNIDPTPSGTFKSACQTITVDTNAPGYTLLAKSSSTDLVYQNPTAISPLPTIPGTHSGTITSPTVLPNDTWGFAVENQLNFDNAYAIDNASNKFAPLSTTNTQIYTTDQFPLPLTQFKFFYAAQLTPATTAGSYSTIITYTAIGEEVAEPVIPFMQEYTHQQCAALSLHQTVMLRDIRNDQIYRIRKMEDDKCWMIDNLMLDDYNITSADSDTSVDYHIPAAQSIQNYFDGSVDWGTEAVFYNDSDISGYTYNINTALAGDPMDSVPYADYNAPNSICPRNWRLPNGKAWLSNGEPDNANDLTLLNGLMAGDGGPSYNDDYVHIANWLDSSKWGGALYDYGPDGFPLLSDISKGGGWVLSNIYGGWLAPYDLAISLRTDTGWGMNLGWMFAQGSGPQYWVRCILTL